MSWFESLRHRLKALTHRGILDADLDDELRFHLDMQIAENIRRGMDPAAARTEALRLFGGVEKVKEECRDERGINVLDTLAQDVRHAFRSLKRSRGFALTAILTLALGIGANTAIFSLVYGVLLAPLPYPNGDQLVLIRASAPSAGFEEIGLSIPELYEYRAVTKTLSDVVEFHGMSFTLLGHGDPSRVLTGVVSPNFFDVLGVRPILGRTFVYADDEPGAEAVLVLSYSYWQQDFGADPQIVGQVFEMNDRPHRVIGVLPPIPHYPYYCDVYMPNSACPYRADAEVRAEEDRHAWRGQRVFARVKPDVSHEEVEAEAALIGRQFVEEYPRDYAEAPDFIATTLELRDELTRDARPTLLILLATVGLVLLIACANVANLMLAHVLRRDRELALRAAMGAGRGRLLRQLLTESTLLSLAGGALGLLLAAAGLDMLVAFVSRFTTRATEVDIDAAVLGFTFLISVGTGVAFGGVPGLSSRANVIQVIKESAGSQTTAGARTLRLRNVLIVGQVAVSFMLLIGAGLMVRSLIKLNQVDPGFSTENVLSAEVFPNWTRYDEREEQLALYGTLLERVRGGPGVLSAALSNRIPLVNQRFGIELAIEGRAEELGPYPELDHLGVTPDYFRTLDVPVVRGRTFTEQEQADEALVAVISESMARHHWLDEDPIGQRISPVFDDGPSWHTIIGVVGDVKHYGLDTEAGDLMYVPHTVGGLGGLLLVRNVADPPVLAEYIRGVVRQIAPEQAIENFRTLEEVRAGSIAEPRLTTTLISLFAGLALLITVAGISGVIAFSVSQRTHEIGIRMALGARRVNVLQMVLGQGLALVGIGLAIGWVGALWLSQLFNSFLFETEPTDPITFLAVAAALLAAALAGCFVPARRATAIDPMLALRTD